MRRRSCRISPAATLPITLVVLELALASTVFADVVSTEFSSSPENEGWDIIQIYCEPELWIEDGWFFQYVDLCPGEPPPGGQTAAYRRSLADFIGQDEFFIEWVVETDADRSEIPWGGGVALSAWSLGGVNYAFSIAGDLAELNRDNLLRIIEVEITPGPHTHRLELFGAELYVWYIDGEIVDSGVPEGAYPSSNPNMNFRNKAAWGPNLARWNYIRYGTISTQPGDFNSDGEIDFYDLYFFYECLTTEAGGWAGCAWADMDFSGQTDCDDWALFVEAWTDPADPPGMAECANPPDFDGNGSVGPFDLAILLGNWGPCPDPPANCPADLDDDAQVNAFDLAILLGSWG